MRSEQQDPRSLARVTHYNNLSVSLHWLVAVTVLALFALGFWMVDLTYYSSWYKTAPHWHKSAGVLLAVLVAFRLLWKVISRVPKPLASHSSLQQRLATTVHVVLYVLLLGILLTGYLISTADGRGIQVFSWFQLPGLGELFAEQADIAGFAHKWCAYVLIVLVFIHAVSALKHHFIDKDTTLRRMWWHKN